MASFKVDLSLLPNNSLLCINQNNGVYRNGVPNNSLICINQNNGVYRNGVAFDVEKKLRVATILKQHESRAADHGRKGPSITAVAKEAGVSRTSVMKIQKELTDHGCIQRPKEKILVSGGVGSKSLSTEDVHVLLGLMERNLFRTRRSYCMRLQQITGTVVSEMTISNFFLRGFAIKGSLRKPNLTPRDKFKPENVDRYFRFVDLVRQIDPRRLKFGDEKLPKGSEVYCKKGRRNVITGECPEFMVNSDFRNTYSIIGFCGIDEKAPPVSFDIHDEKNNAVSFSNAIIQAIAKGFLRCGDVLILDNAAIHFKGQSEYWT